MISARLSLKVCYFLCLPQLLAMGACDESLFEPCEETLIRTEIFPDYDIAVELVERGCGATSPIATRVNINFEENNAEFEVAYIETSAETVLLNFDSNSLYIASEDAYIRYYHCAESLKRESTGYDINIQCDIDINDS